ncbi:MAG TPA: PQQ-binding-like beta-propeller repeat protein [Actinomycetota bacterium]|jgi:outer membrane protein assembly factor BamB
MRITLRLLAATAAVVLCATTPPAAASADPGRHAAGPYPQFLYRGENRVNPLETTLTRDDVSQLTLLWTHSTGSLNVFAAPVVDRDMVFEGEYRCCPAPSRIEAFDGGTGSLLWTFSTPAPVVAAAAVHKGVVFAGDYNGTLDALHERTGDLLWSGDAGGQVFDPDNVTVHGSRVFTVGITPGIDGPSRLSAWNVAGCGAQTCEPLWTASFDTGVGPGPAVVGNTVYVASDAGWLYALRASGCSAPACDPLWRAKFPAPGASNVFQGLAVARGLVYVGNGSSSVVDVFPAAGCGAPTCKPLWSYDAGPAQPGGLAIVKRKLYAGTAAGLAAYPARCRMGSVCTPVWLDSSAPATTHLLVANRVVYATFGTTLLADDASTGDRLWQVSTPDPCQAPTVADGVVYCASTFADEILAFGLPAVSRAHRSRARPRGRA